jgi:hypothetical protein
MISSGSWASTCGGGFGERSKALRAADLVFALLCPHAEWVRVGKSAVRLLVRGFFRQETDDTRWSPL